MESTGSDSRRVIKVLFGVPNEGHTASRAYDNRMEMCTHLGVLQTLSSLGLQTYCDRVYDIPDGVEYQFNIGVVGETFPALARERLVDIALEGEMDYLFMIDDDMLVPADTFELLIKNDVDICAALAFTRHDHTNQLFIIYLVGMMRWLKRVIMLISQLLPILRRS